MTIPFVYTGIDMHAEGEAYELTYKGVSVDMLRDEAGLEIRVSVEVEDKEADTLWTCKLSVMLDPVMLCQTRLQLTPQINHQISAVLIEELPSLRHENLSEIITEVADLLEAFLPR
ncbi:hypothetical protein Cp1R7AA1_237 [Mesorhizobium phage Cp1R7A-A1]|nr:hypothetical protein Cp1R7AA1_237 [Mesorhizobium phage Cp1R7A-A1]